ncbi:hypothetical protein [Maribacter sp. 4G9]|nr:hypothetical protein [Maribacter sp. 4G9]
MKKGNKIRKSLGYLEVSKTLKIYQICDVVINGKEIIVSTRTPVAP